jgi:hypothetical protein
VSGQEAPTAKGVGRYYPSNELGDSAVLGRAFEALIPSEKVDSVTAAENIELRSEKAAGGIVDCRLRARQRQTSVSSAPNLNACNLCS